LQTLETRFELSRPSLCLCKLPAKLSQLLPQLFDLMIAATELVLVEAVRVVSVEELPMGLFEMATKLLLVHAIPSSERCDGQLATPTSRAAREMSANSRS
jgi:hypothetical protein